jgi:hypothetical protein
VTLFGPMELDAPGLRWEGTRWDGSGSPTVSGSPERHAGENGLARIWLEIRAWISWCDGSVEADARSFHQFLEEVAEAKISLSQIRRADIEKWVAGARDWEQPPDESRAKLPRSLP